MSQKHCLTCQGTGRIVRGHDGRVIRCPNCMGRSRRRQHEPPPAEISERELSENLRQQERAQPTRTQQHPPRIRRKYIPKTIPASGIFWGGLIILVLVILIASRDELPEYEQRTTYTPPAQPVGNIDEAKQYMLRLVNHERQKAGVPPVKLGHNQAAQLHAEEAIKGCYSSHWDRWGLKPSHRYTLAGGTGADAENISGHDSCVGPGDGYRPLNSLSYEVSDTVNGLMQSRGHRRTILNPAHTILNAGIAHNRYRISVVQQFSSDYLTYQKRPTIDQQGTLELEASTEGASLDIGKYVNIQIFYDPPPQPLTRDQLYYTYSSCGGPKAAYIISPRSSLPQGGTVEVKEETTVQRCTDPQEVGSSRKAPRDPAVIEAQRDSIKQQALRPKEITENVHMVAATSLDKTNNSINIRADLNQVLEFHGPGIYTVVIRGRPDHMSDNATISEQALFWGVTPPKDNPYQQAKEPAITRN